MRCVPAHHFTVAKARTWRSAIEEHPPYQRESAVWSLDQQQLFIDSLLNGYDVPKIYLHDLRGRDPTKVYAIVDGKQRLTTIWRYLDDGFALAADFRVEPGNLPEIPTDAVTPAGALRFSQLDPHWQGVLTRTYLSVVLIRDATEEDIEDLFSRLNNGEALNAAERRNALGGDMARLIREVASRPFLTERLHFSNARLQHFDFAARLLAAHAARRRGVPGIPDLGPTALDTFVREGRHVGDTDQNALLLALDAELGALSRVFTPADPLLASPAQAFLACRFVSEVFASHRTDVDPSAIRGFLDSLHRTRAAALDAPEDEAGSRAIERQLAILHAAYERSVGPGTSVGGEVAAEPQPSGPWATPR